MRYIRKLSGVFCRANDPVPVVSTSTKKKTQFDREATVRRNYLPKCISRCQFSSLFFLLFEKKFINIRF